MNKQDVYEAYIRRPSEKANEIGKRKPYHMIAAEMVKKRSIAVKQKGKEND